MIRKNGALSVCTVITFLLLFWSNADATSSARKEDHASKIDGLSIEFVKGRLSVDIKDVDAKVVFKALGEKGKIEIVNQRILICWSAICPSPAHPRKGIKALVVKQTSN